MAALGIERAWGLVVWGGSSAPLPACLPPTVWSRWDK